MAPPKPKSDKKQQPEPSAARVTRSSTRLLQPAGGIEKPPAKPVPATVSKKKKTPLKKTTENVTKEAEEQVKGITTVVIEHCKQCNQFKTRAFKVKDGLESGVPGITVLINPEKPRRGCFEIRKEGGEKFISLLDMKRPFAPMRALDMDNVISDIINKIK